MDQETPSELDNQFIPIEKIKPKPLRESNPSFRKKASEFKDKLLKFKGKSAPISPITDDEDMSVEDDKNPPSSSKK